MAAQNTFSARIGWPHWLGALLFGVLLVLLVLIASWLLRACAPVDAAMNVAALQSPAPPAPEPPPDPTPALKASLQDTAADGRTLAAERDRLEAALNGKVAACRPIEPPKPVEAAKPPPPPPAPAPLPADRWANKDLGLLQGCWRLGRDTESTLTKGIGGRAELCTVKAGRICFGANGTGQRETTSLCPTAGTVRCSAPITATFGNDGTLGTRQPVVKCNPPSTVWNGPVNALSCRRQS